LSERKEHLRTYKVGLKVPESLVKRQNQLIIEREIIHFLRNSYFEKNKCTLFSKKLRYANASILSKYTQVYKKYKNYSLKELTKRLKNNRNCINSLQKNNPLFSSNSFTKKDIPKFIYKKNGVSNFYTPTSQEISLHDYQYVANKSLKLICKHLNTLIIDNITSIPSLKEELLRDAFTRCQEEGRSYSKRQLQSRFEIALSCVTGIHSNLGRTAFYQLGIALKGYFDLRQKVHIVSNMIRKDFIEIIPVLLTYYSIPRHFILYLSKLWNVDAHWIRNTLVGWRRKLDSLLPQKFQIEGLNELFIELANYYQQYAVTNEEVKVIGRLQKKHILHLLSHKNIDLCVLLPKQLRKAYINLQERIKPLPPELKSSLEQYLILIDKNEFKKAAFQLIDKVEHAMVQFPFNSSPYKNCQTFLRKIQAIIEYIDAPPMKELLQNYVVGNRFTGAVARLYSDSRFSRLFTAFRGIYSLTLAKKFSSAIGQFKKVFNPDRCITIPFTSHARKKIHLPVNLLFNKYIVLRKATPISTEFLTNKSGVTEKFKDDKPIWLGLPIYSPDQLVNGVLQGRKNGTFWFQLVPSKKIVKCLQQGAIVRDIRLNIPKGPTRKIIADIVLSSSDKSCFHHEGNFLKSWDNKFSELQFPSHSLLGVDFNRIGKYMVAVATPDSELNITKMMELYESTYEKLEIYRTCEIPNIQSKIDKNSNGKEDNSKKMGRLKAQITLLYQKQQNLMKEMKRQAIMLYLFIAYKTGANYLSWDSIGGISNRGKSGALAQAITYLPKQKAQFELCKQWAEDLRTQQLLNNYKDIIPVSSFTSQICAHCFKNTGKLKKTLVKGLDYDIFQCKECSKTSNRHSNAAQVSALLLEQNFHTQHCITPSPLTMG
jgi:hypothetical protein